VARLAPGFAGSIPLRFLGLLVGAQDLDHGPRQGDRPPGPARLRRQQHEAARLPVERAADGQRLAVEVHVRPAQPQRLAAPEPEEDEHDEQAVQPVLPRRLQEGAGLLNAE
jgi:hypothetical protein